jgi:P27 family predicted phage terminase small subunit
LSDIDRPALEILSTSLATYREAQAHVNEHGSVLIGTTGTPIKNPYLGVQKDCWDRIRVLLAEFGLTPSARARLKLDDRKGDEGESLI